MIDRKKIKHSSLFLIIILMILWIFDANQPKLLKNTQNNVQNDNFYDINGLFFALDGDSLRKENTEIRLLKIDAPEYKQTCFDKNKKEYECGKISTKFLRKLVKNRKLNCKYQKKDMYDRYLAICYDGNKNINYEMIKSGMAIIYNIHDASEELKLLEKTARDSNIGIWQGRFLIPKEFRRLKKDE